MEYILGIRADYRGLLVKPCIPSDWPEYKAVRHFRGCEYQIHVLNPHKLCKGKPVIEVNGERWNEMHLPVSPVCRPVVAGTGRKEPKKYNIKVVLEKEDNID
jgi:cellobiose phosphorylase